MSHNPTDRADAQLAARFQMPGAQHCFLWERSELLDEERDLNDLYRWYELTFGELPSHSCYAERLTRTSNIDAADLAVAAAQAAAWVDERWQHESSGPTAQDNRPRLREEDLLLLDPHSHDQEKVEQDAVGVEQGAQHTTESQLYSTEWVGVFEPWESASLYPSAKIELRNRPLERVDLETAHVMAIHRELECRISLAAGLNDGSAHVISFFNPLGELPTVVDASHNGVQQALRAARDWVSSQEQQPQAVLLKETPLPQRNSAEHTADEQLAAWWPIVRRGDLHSSAAEALLGLVQARDERQAVAIAAKTLDYGLGPERLEVKQDCQGYGAVAARDRLFVMWVVDEQGRAEQYTSATELARVVDVSSRYEKELAECNQPLPAVIVTEWNEPGELPLEIALERWDEPGEPTEFAVHSLGRLVSEQEVLEVRSSRDSEPEPQVEGEPPHYLIWETRGDGTLRRRGYELDPHAARERAVELALADRIEHGRLPELSVTSWPAQRELPPRTIAVGSSRELGRPIPFNLDAEIAQQYPVPENPLTLQSTSPAVDIVRVQSTVDLKEGDYIMIGHDPHGERVGYVAVAGLGPEQLEARPKYAVIDRETRRVIAVRNLPEEAAWAAEPNIDAEYARNTNLRAATLPWSAERAAVRSDEWSAGQPELPANEPTSHDQSRISSQAHEKEPKKRDVDFEPDF
ncbi:hypothetical protein NG895_02090 [Aeoliella sp. ICT_H6.2]|uniref:Uncharacterized protein n=1 Tax=Aeoliella straminimaris TaxID=2954799 RepID=A0A9X2JEI7_9BACT|nr:hypothetical protein [Aeoliella straminimaris]MCO6042686.1 hypothetical protein [Aeoliella straminimaris]